jgi:hypothetical protein
MCYLIMPKGANELVLQHHDMEGGKMHHNTELTDDRKSGSRGSGGGGGVESLSKGLSYYLNGASRDEYYDEVEGSRDKGRSKNDPYYDAESSSEDYLGSEDDKKSLLLALERLNSKSPEHAKKKEKIMKQINRQLPNTVSSKIELTHSMCLDVVVLLSHCSVFVLDVVVL